MENLKIFEINDSTNIKILMSHMIEEIIYNIFSNKAEFVIEKAKNDNDLIENDVENKFEIFLNTQFFQELKIMKGHNILAVKNCPQLKGALCGFHTLFNLRNFLNFYFIYDLEVDNFDKNSNKNNLFFNEALYYLEKMNNRSK